MDFSVTEELTYTTLRIECTLADGAVATGTGFIMAFKEDHEKGQIMPVVITNKHVIKGAENVRFVFTQANADSRPMDQEHFPVDFNRIEGFWRMHPNPEVDLCCMPLMPCIRAAEDNGVRLYFGYYGMDHIPTQTQLDEMSAMEDVIMVGYPNGLWDVLNNKPILRKGITATHPRFDYNGRKEFLIDAACFAGSSGSPVFLLRPGSYHDRVADYQYTNPHPYLLGILYAGPQQGMEGKVQIIDVPTVQKQISVTAIPINLGIVIKSECIKELEQLF